MKLALILSLLSALTLAACHGSDTSQSASPPSSSAPSRLSEGWDSHALRAAQDLATTVAARGITCERYSPYDFEAIANSYKNRLPVPASMTSCTGPDEEDITFNVFTDDRARDGFMASKLYVMCRSASQRNITGLVRVPYVEGPTWIVEPDQEATADELARILGGVSKRGTCPSLTVATNSARP